MTTRGALVFFVAATAVFAAPHNVPAEVASADDLRTKIQSRTEEIKEIEREIAEYKQKIETTAGEKRTLQSAIATIDTARAKLAKDIQLTDKKIDRTRLAAAELGLAIKQKEVSVERNKRMVAEIIRRIDQAEGNSLLEVFLGSASIAEFFTETDDLAKLEMGIADHTKSLKRLTDELTAEKDDFEREHTQLATLAEEIVDQKRMADEKRAEQDRLLRETKNKETNYRTLLADREKRKKQFEREIDDFEAELRAIIDPNSIPKPGTKALAAPLDNLTITQHFGRTVDARRLYASGTHNGVDFRAAPGTPIKAAARGIVMGTGDTDATCRWASYGKWVLIGHPNGLATLYAHLDLMKAEKGQEVEVGQLIGYSGNTGYSTGPHLHFTVYAKSAVEITDFPSKSCPGAVFRIPVAAQNAYLDPEAYL